LDKTQRCVISDRTSAVRKGRDGVVAVSVRSLRKVRLKSHSAPLAANAARKPKFSFNETDKANDAVTIRFCAVDALIKAWAFSLVGLLNVFQSACGQIVAGFSNCRTHRRPRNIKAGWVTLGPQDF
jgi:hypothetical protein